MGAPEVRAFLSSLAQTLTVSASIQNQALNAITFLYHQVLHRELGEIGQLPRARRPKHLPVVFSPDEVRTVLAHLIGTDHLMTRLLSGPGLRLAECVSRRVKALDFEKRVIAVRQGKGDKDRVTVLPHNSVTELHRPLERVRDVYRQDLLDNYAGTTVPESLERKYPSAPREFSWQFPFPASRRCHDPNSGRERRHHIDASVLPRAVKTTVLRSGISKNGSCHSDVGTTMHVARPVLSVRT